jgi:hypothetical protein
VNSTIHAPDWICQVEICCQIAKMKSPFQISFWPTGISVLIYLSAMLGIALLPIFPSA